MFSSLIKSFGFRSAGDEALEPKNIQPPIEQAKFDVPGVLGGMQAPNASVLAEKAGIELSPEMSLGKPKSSAELLNHLLNDKQDMLGATKSIAHSLSPQDGVKWAVDSCKQVEAKLSPGDREAIMAADAFATVPNAANRAVAGAAAVKAGMQSPAGLAAKAASMVDVPDAPAVPGAHKLVPACVTGAVVCAAALSAAKAPGKNEVPKMESSKPAIAQPKVPDMTVTRTAAPPPPAPGSPESARNVSAFKPFIEAGLALAAGVAIAKSKK